MAEAARHRGPIGVVSRQGGLAIQTAVPPATGAQLLDGAATGFEHFPPASVSRRKAPRLDSEAGHRPQGPEPGASRGEEGVVEVDDHGSDGAGQVSSQC